MIIRRFQVTDANEISALFREVYAERYVYSDLYVPAMITWRNTQHDWYSAVAVINNKIIGHAALRRENSHATCAELAMIVVHPMAQHRGIAFKLGKYLYDEAHKTAINNTHY
ncbi:Predicted acetyltransferase [Providencia alcalifaciens]|nr:Predicted acetyltransferase [Providencia alcalifaciens]